MTRTQIALHVVVSVALLLSLGLLALREIGRPIVPGRDPTPEPPPVDKEWTPANLWPIFDAASALKPVRPVNETIPVSDKVQGDYRYITEKHNVVENRESVLFLGMNDDVLFPGAIIEGTEVYDFVYHPVIVARTPITLSLSLEGVTTTGKSITVTVDDPSRLSNVRQGINDLLKSAISSDTKVPAKFDYTSEQVYSREERNLALGVSGSYADVSVDSDFNWKSERERNKILSIYKQVYYTVDIDLPSTPFDFFDPDAGVEGVAEALPAGSMPMFVSSVSYGWMGLLFIETDFSKEQMDTALAVAYDPAGDLEAKLDFGYSTRDVLQSSKIQIIVYGGSTAGITSSTLSGYSGLMELIDGSKEFGSNSPGVPLSYKLRHLSNNLIARMALTEEYTITRAIKLREFVRITVDRFYCQYEDDASGPVDMDRFNFSVQVFAGAPSIFSEQILGWGGAEQEMEATNSWVPPYKASTVVMLDLQKLDPDAYRLVLNANARDYDTTSADEWAVGSHTLSGSQLYNPSNKFFQIIDPGDMTFFVYYTIEPATAAECETYTACYALLHPPER